MNIEISHCSLEIKGLRLRTIIGVLEEERVSKQEVELDIKINLDLIPALESDNLQDTVDYALLTEKISFIVENSSFNLIESLGHTILKEILSWPYVKEAQITVKKNKSFAMRFAKGVSFQIVGVKNANN